eukprot:CAMPEP_0197078740 /NCGR_PEP_ID=MMETSP1384-20130603/213271_1 /TAXON_ID=29189 /ORGANISM="Ammonia sp." /LENGTH=415 /DNA_ID=CAMNT_0042517609 /DNA_START=415 /DNA_END=1662 /DNA_ORIENTATION=+
MKGLRKYIMGIKVYNEWGYYYLRKSGRFCDAKALQVMFGDEVMAALEEQKLIKPITLPPEVMNDEVFPPTTYKATEVFEAARQKYNPMPMEEGFFAKLNFYRLTRDYYKNQKQWKRKQKLLTEWQSEGKTADEIVLLLKEEGLLDVEDRSLIAKEEMADFTKSNQVLSKHPLFQKLMSEKHDIYSKFKDLEWFTVRELGIMKEYGQIGLVKLDEKGKTVVDYKTDPLIVNENGVPKGVPPPQQWADYKNMTQEELHEIYEGDYPITVPEKGNFLRMKPEKEAEFRKAAAMRFIEWKRDLDERAKNQIRKMKRREAMERGEEVELEPEPRHSAYVMSTHAIAEKYDREGVVQTKFEINRSHKKIGPKYYKRFIGNAMRPRRSSIKRWSHMWTKRMVIGKKIKRRKGSYMSRNLSKT